MTDEQRDMDVSQPGPSEAPPGPLVDPGETDSSCEPAPAFGWRDLATAIGIMWALEIGLAILSFAVLLTVSGFDLSSLNLQVSYFLPAIVFSWTGSLVVMWYFGCRKYRIPFRETFAVRPVSQRTLLYSACGGLGCAVVAGIFMVIFSSGEAKIAELIFEPPSEEGGKTTISLVFVAIALTLPLLEEVYYRGFLYGALQRLVGVPLAVTIVIVWFGLVHAPQLAGDWTGLIPVTIMGAVFTVLRQWQGSILPSIVAHLSYNFVLVLVAVVGLAVS